MKKINILIIIMTLIIMSTANAALYRDTCWSLTNGISCINGTTGQNILTGMKINFSDVLNAGGITDTNETTRFNTLVGTDCTGDDKVSGVANDGSLVCTTDQSGAGSYDLNITGDTGSESITDAEILDVVGSGTVSTDMSGLVLTITGTSHTTAGDLAGDFVSRNTWTDIDNYPTACNAGEYVNAIADTLTCTDATTEINTVVATKDECSEITNCVPNAYDALADFTTTLTDTYYCRYNNAGTEINCDVDPSTILTTSTSWGGDLSGTGVNPEVSDDSHAHVVSNIDNLESSFQCGGTDQMMNVSIGASGITGVCTSQGSGGGITSFEVSNGSTTDTVTDGETINITAGSGITIDQTNLLLTIASTVVDTTINNCSETDSCVNIVYEGELTTGLATKDECSEITNCVDNAYDALADFTTTLTDTYICRYNDGGTEINCDVDPASLGGEAGGNPFDQNLNTTEPQVNFTSIRLGNGSLTTEDIYLYFSDDNPLDEYIKWDESDDWFLFTDEVDIIGTLTTDNIESLDWTNVTITESQVTDANWWDADEDIAADTISESKIIFSTACTAGNHYYLNGNDLACEANTVDTNETTRMNNIAGFSCTGDDKISSFGANGLPVCTTDELGGGGFTYSDHFDQYLNTTNHPTFRNLTLGETTDGEDIYLYFSDDAENDEYLRWDNGNDRWQFSDSIRVDIQVSADNIYADNGVLANGNIYSNADFYTSGAGDDLWLGDTTQGNANFRAYATGEIHLDADSIPISLGEGQDADIYYDGTDLIIDSSVVGTGSINVTNNNITTVDCIWFNSGGKICSGS